MNTSTAKQRNIDYAVQAKSALAAVERLTAEIDDVPRKTTMCREKWRDYGAALLEQRKVMPSNQQFGQWVKANGLDQGLAADRIVRSNAMWLAEHFDIVASDYNGGSHHPTHIREACRQAGYEWAGETEHQKERKKKSVRTEQKKKRYSWVDVAADEGLLPSVKLGGTTQKWKSVIAKEFPEVDLKSPDDEHALRNACQTLIAQQQPETVTAVVEEAKATVNESAKARFDRAVAKARAALEGAFQARLNELQASYEAEVEKAVKARIGPELEAARRRAQESIDRNDRMMRNFKARRDGIKQAMTKKDLKLLLNCLHPDRAPADRADRFAEAFRIAKRLQPYVDSFDE